MLSMSSASSSGKICLHPEIAYAIAGTQASEKASNIMELEKIDLPSPLRVEESIQEKTDYGYITFKITNDCADTSAMLHGELKGLSDASVEITGIHNFPRSLFGSTVSSKHISVARELENFLQFLWGPAEAMRSHEVLACQYPVWQPKLRKHTFRTRTLQLPNGFEKILLSDSIHLPSYILSSYITSKSEWDTDSSDSFEASLDSDEDATTETGYPLIYTPEFKALCDSIKKAIQELGGNVVLKLNWSSPKDAKWMLGSLQCTSASEVLLQLQSSAWIQHDLDKAFTGCQDLYASTNFPKVNYKLSLRKFVTLSEGMEFRSFVAWDTLIALCQRDVGGYFSFLQDRLFQAEIMNSIQSKFETVLRPSIELKRFVFDVYIHMQKGDITCRIVDLSPWGTTTDPLLFTWDELRTKAFLEKENVEFRYIKSEAGKQLKSEELQQLPQEMLDLSLTSCDDNAIDTFVKAAQKTTSNEDATLTEEISMHNESSTAV
ncbi:hypothetical protein IE077_004056 [Cardiosporidium cionae]|uniref:Cell division cycle protein 123 n=1 Tax=Cardiosporidium cionae TaxID=476202 RepID=A0ABQ7J6X3_9APIC|nr:hypothetical protein IE077_004056 [Cardiosporidium cionae]|eukprot:KAF8819740.1 hypothetical protein IE077_004056 [Cardiosporidium cionae]